MWLQIVKLSDAVQPMPRQTTAFVHGVPHSFIKVGEEKAKSTGEGEKPRFERGAYFIGKVSLDTPQPPPDHFWRLSLDTKSHFQTPFEV